MQSNRKPIVAVIFALLILFTVQSYAVAQEQDALVATANGEGTITAGREKFKVTAVVVKLLNDGTAEISLVSEITFFVSGTWAKSTDANGGIDLRITGGATGGGLAGSGKLFLSPEKKSVVSLKLDATNKQTNRQISVSFTGK